jgi:hypothetical protein
MPRAWIRLRPEDYRLLPHNQPVLLPIFPGIHVRTISLDSLKGAIKHCPFAIILETAGTSISQTSTSHTWSSKSNRLIEVEISVLHKRFLCKVVRGSKLELERLDFNFLTGIMFSKERRSLGRKTCWTNVMSYHSSHCSPPRNSF